MGWCFGNQFSTRQWFRSMCMYPIATLALIIFSPLYLLFVAFMWLASGQLGFDMLLWVVVKFGIPLYPITQEDSRIERELLNMKGKTLVTICASGDRVLESMVQAPKKVVAVDLNPAQLALLDLKLACIENLEYETVCEIFHSMNVKTLEKHLPLLLTKMTSPASMKFWKRQGANYLHCLYKGGTSGIGMQIGQWCIHYMTGIDISLMIKKPEIIHELWKNEWREVMTDMLYYIWHVPFAWNALMTPMRMALGVPPRQGSLRGCLCESPEAMLKYFDRVLGSKHFQYNTEFVAGQLGHYGEEKPYWMKPEAYSTLKANVRNCELENGYMTEVLRKQPVNSVDALLLSDHQDWMSQNEILQEWQQIQRVARKGCEVMWRTAAMDEISYPFCLNSMEYKNQERLDEFLDSEDRLPSYRHHHVVVDETTELRPRISVDPKRSLLSDFKNLYYILYKGIAGKLMRLRGREIDNWSEFFYRGQAKTYDSFRHYMLHGRKQLMGVLPLKAGTVWADIGCGTGFNLEYLSDWIVTDDCKHVYLVDYSPSMLKQAKRRIKQLGIEHKTSFIHCDCSKGIDIDGEVNLITFSYSLCMIPGWETALRSAIDLLAPGGHIGATDFTSCEEQHPLMKWFWKVWFKNDHVFLSEKHLQVLSENTEPRVQALKFGGLPYIPFFLVPYYFYLGEKK